jgi:sulfofructose kinase
MAQFDIVGVGLNATDTLIFVDRYPASPGKARILREVVSLGGQVASALTVCARFGFRARYVGCVGDDERGRVQLSSLSCLGIDVSDVKIRSGCSSQCAYIVVDVSTAERTIIWNRDDRLAIAPEDVNEAQIGGARLLHIDGHDTAAVARASAIARALGIPVSADVDTIYPGLETVLPNVDYLISGSGFPAAWTREPDPFRALERLGNEYGCRVAASTLGEYGALARVEGRFCYIPGFQVDAVDSTGAGDVFHGAFCYAVLDGMKMADALEFACAAAALNCTAPGTRGGIRELGEIRAFMRNASRRTHSEFHSRSAAST